MSVTADLFCPDCGYNLRGIDSQRCPECGLEVDRAALSRSQIPWEHRRQIGGLRAYWRTVRLATFRPKELAAAVNAPVSFGDARRFWVNTVILVCMPLWAAALVVHFYYGLFGDAAHYLAGDVLMWGTWQWWERELAYPWLAGVNWWFVPPLAVLLFVLSVTAAAGWFFLRREMPVVHQNRAIALSYYSCGPLAWSAPLMLVAAGVGWMLMQEMMPRELALFVAVLLGALLAAWWAVSWWMMKRVTHAAAGRALAMAVLLPVIWMMLGALTLFGVPWVLGLIRLMVLSFRLV